MPNPGICRREHDLRICDIRGIELHRKALTCAESLLTESDDIPDICKKTVVIVTPVRQEYVYHELDSRVSVIFACEGEFHGDLWEGNIAALFRERPKQYIVASRMLSNHV